MKTIKTYKYNEKYEAELINEDSKLSEAMELLLKEEIDFFKICENGSFLEITLSDKNDIITNGYEL